MMATFHGDPKMNTHANGGGHSLICQTILPLVTAVYLTLKINTRGGGRRATYTNFYSINQSLDAIQKGAFLMHFFTIIFHPRRHHI